jgi:hypothetical protein
VVPAVFLNLFVTTPQDSNRVRDAIADRIALNPLRTFAEPVTAQPWHRNIQIVNALVFCPDAADADALYQGVQDAWAQGPQSGRIRPGSWVKRIDSYEDEGLMDVVLAEATK